MIQEICSVIGGQLSQAFQRDIKVYTCESRTVGGLDSLYLEFDGALPDTISMQYQIKKSTNVTLMFTGTAKTSTFNGIENDFHQAIKSIQFK